MRPFARTIARLCAFSALVSAVIASPGEAMARTAQVCLGPDNIAPPPVGCFTIDTSVIGGRAFADYVVTRPGSLFFDIAARRKELARLTPDAAALYCAVNPAARAAASLPQLTFASTRVDISANQFPFEGRLRADDFATITFTDLRTSDGLTYPTFRLNLQRQRGSNRLDLSFRAGPEGTAIPGLDEAWFFVDVVTGEFTYPRLATFSETARRLLLALIYHLPALYSGATQVLTSPGPVDPPWTIGAIIENATKFQSAAFSTPQPRFDPVISLTCSLSGSYQTCVEEPALRGFADYMQLYGADYLMSGDPATGAALLSNLRAWASANALSVFPGIALGQPNQPDFLPKYLLQQILLPVITTWSLLRHDPLVTPADRVLIEGWLNRVVAYGTEPFGGPQNDYFPFNVGYLTLGVRMAWGVLNGSDTAVAEGVERIYMGLHQMRPDGSFPREVARGACALRYQSIQTQNLLVLAELAARQGYDAYALSVEGKTLHHAVKFILDAIDSPGVIAGYAAANPTACDLPPGSPMETNRIITAPGGGTVSAWIEPYIARFPSHPNSARLWKFLQGGLTANRPVRHSYSGSNTTCFSADGRPAPITPPKTAVEYYHAGFDHYFVTADLGEIDKLDDGTFSGWTRSGAAFGIFPLATAGTSSVCRFFSTSFAPKSSHFYTPFADECAAVRANADWQFEASVFAMKLPDASGNCTSDTAPLYRLYNDGRSGAPNHRYTTQAAIRSEMVARGFVSEGFGALGVIGCVPK